MPGYAQTKAANAVALLDERRTPQLLRRKGIVRCGNPAHGQRT
ncbi:hypothetical protein AB0P36_05410 [Streptomyces flavidovirens]